MHIIKNRLFQRSLLGLLIITIAALAIDYLFITNYVAKAKQEFISEQQKLVLGSLTATGQEIAASAPVKPEQKLQQIAMENGLPYLILVNRNLMPDAYIPASLFPEQLKRLSANAGDAFQNQDKPLENLTALNGIACLNITAKINGQDTLVIYGLPLLVLDRIEQQAYRLNRYLLVLLLFAAASFAVFRVMRPRLLSGSDALPPAPEKKPEIQKIRELAEETGDGLLAIAKNGDISLYNAAALKLLQITPPNTNGKPFNIYTLFDDKVFSPEQQSKLRMALQSENSVEKVDFDNASGKNCFKMAIFTFGNDHLCILRDITDKKQCAMMLARSNEMLEQAIEQRTHELLITNERLRKENSERRAAEQALAQAESRYREMVDNSIEGIFQRTADGRMISANIATARILGYSSVEELLQQYSAPGAHISHTTEMEYAINELLDVRGWVSNLEFQAKMQDGSPVWVAMNARRVASSTGETLYYEAFIEDITSRKKTEEKLVYQAFHDPLTRLPNRALFLDRLRMALRRAKRHPEYLFAVLYLDLDRFKNINDNFGHSAGDKMLNHATEKLLQCVREADTVARFGGDEFAVLLTDLEKPAQAVFITKRITSALNDSIVFHGQDVSIGASIGIVLSNPEYDTPEEILRDADTAMYRAKMHGRRCFTVFNRRMREETIKALAMENDLRYAVERKEIEAYYQPLVHIEDGKIYGFEALMRWRRKDEVVGPALFIPIAEETGLINELGLEILQNVSRQIVKWNKDLGHEDYSVHVNISGKQLMANRFWRDVKDILEETGVNPRQLIFEITESVFLDYGSQVISAMNIIREFGIRFCLDDFGTGFSSLSYLRLLPLESLKVDRSFIIDLHNDRYSEAILRNLISMGNDLALDVITEGVDQESQVSVLLSVGCEYAQGYYFARPLAADVALDHLKKHGSSGKSLHELAKG